VQDKQDRIDTITQQRGDMRFEVFMVMKIQVMVFWVVMLCSDVVGCLLNGVITQKTMT
jgi:hypothetical protein